MRDQRSQTTHGKVDGQVENPSLVMGLLYIVFVDSQVAYCA